MTLGESRVRSGESGVFWGQQQIRAIVLSSTSGETSISSLSNLNIGVLAALILSVITVGCYYSQYSKVVLTLL